MSFLATNTEDEFIGKAARSTISRHEAPSEDGVDQYDNDKIDPKEERAFVWRLDLGFLVIGFLDYVFSSTWIKSIYQWYLPEELALRMSLYNIAQLVGAMLSGAIQGSLATNLDGSLGRAGWR
ncbi:hypothetical protein BDV19DRAFT_384075 [Aspergillus venezuelensis]